MPSLFPTEPQSPFRFSSLIFFSVFSLFFPLSLSNYLGEVDGVFCRNVSSNGSPLTKISDPNPLMKLKAPTNSQGWSILSPEPSSSSSASPVLYALAQCFGGLSESRCEQCFSMGRNKLQQCLPFPSGRIYLNGCFLRYDRFNFFHQVSEPQTDTVKCSTTGRVMQPYLYHDFWNKLTQSLISVTQIASAHEGFGVVEAKGGLHPVYVLAQCWKTLSKSGCASCLQSASRRLTSCLPRTEGIAMNAGCYLRYSTTQFYNDEAREIVDSNPKGPVVFAFFIVAIIAFLVLALLGGCLGYAKLSEKQTAQGRLSEGLSSNRSNLNFNYETLERATDSFNTNRKLGQGGAGTVFRGELPDGRIVAVKRLAFGTRHWVDEFFNEVNLISRINHDNLIKLLGCSIEGPESLLVYEFVPNNSLDQYLFGKNKTQILTWKQRFNIIVGTAKGLAYLHDESEPRIIHRDIKCSNILLDENMTAKIADFGLARHFSTDKTHLSTGIAGTMGYMAPEYLLRGQLTEKADVFSFGVLVLETICGRRNSVFMQDGSILHTVWSNYQSNTLLASIDPSMGDGYSVKEACDMLQIGLLCTQASVSSRPSMSEVVQMLTNDDYMIPKPAEPPFLNNSWTSDNTEFFSVCGSSSFGSSCGSSFGSSCGSLTIEVSQPR